MAQTGDRRAAAPPSGADWTVQAADAVERVVVGIRDKTAVPLTTVARGLVFGLLAAAMGLSALVLLAIATVRALDVYLPGRTWSAHLLVGGIFTGAGGLLLRKATAKARKGAGAR